MWINPKYRDQVEQRQPPADTGRRLATFDRGQGVEMRATLTEYEGNPYISLRVWEANRDGEWWPTRRGCSVRISEAAELAEALADVAGLSPGGGTRPGRLDPTRGPSAPWGSAVAEAKQPQAEGTGEFDEFDGEDE
jgi:hypothetical protein